MKKQKKAEYHVDYLLKQTLTDDLPAEVEKGMHCQLQRFREKTAKQRQYRPDIIGFLMKLFDMGDLRLKLGQQLIKSAALTFASIVVVMLLAAAFFVPVSGSQNDLAESFSTLTTSIYVSREMSRISAMECSVQAVTEKGEQLNYAIRWTPPGRTRVDIITRDNTIVKTLWIKNRRVTIADTVNNSVHHVKGIEHIDDPQFRPVKDFISPGALMNGLTGKWRARAYRRLKECDRGTYAVFEPGEKMAAEITVDMCTFLPIEMKKYHPTTGVSIRFIWETPAIPRLIDLKSRG